MKSPCAWLFDQSTERSESNVEGLVDVESYSKYGRPPEEVVIMERAKAYEADAVFFEAERDGKSAIAQAFIYSSNRLSDDYEFALLHKRLWSWGGVPLIYRVKPGLVQLFRCAHKPDFEEVGEIACKPYRILKSATKIADDPWWDANRLRNGTLWDEPEVCKKLLSSRLSAQKTLILEVKELYHSLNQEGVLPKALRRRLLILSVLIAYLEARQVFEDGFFGRFKTDATRFFQVLSDGPSLVSLLDHLEGRFNGHVFVLSESERETLATSKQLTRFARLVEARQESSGQLTLWERYSFADLPIELISHIYQLFVKDSSVAVYTPHFLVKMMLGEVLSWKRLDRLEANDEVILDGACGSGIFLVEAYKRLILHWRYKNNWKQPNQTILKKLLRSRIRGTDLEEGAIELAAFSLCLALCDALEPMEIRSSIKLFPTLKEKTLHTKCFFETREEKIIRGKIGVIVGNPPFASRLDTDSAKRAYSRYQNEHGALPDKQVAYLFLHESMEMLEAGGVLSMLQQYNFLYNQQSKGFRQEFFKNWDVREILDFISVRGLFQKGSADTKVIVVVAEAQPPPQDRQVLHATFRRSGRADAEQGFDIDYYDMHWLGRSLLLSNDLIWRSNLLGGGRVLAFANRLKEMRNIAQYAESLSWDYGEGFIEGRRNVDRPADHIIDQPLLISDSITENGIDESRIIIAENKQIEGPRSSRRFTPPMLLVREEQFDLHHDLWEKSYLTYKNQIVGFCPGKKDLDKLIKIDDFLIQNKKALRAFVAAISVKLFTQHATTLSGSDIYSLPFPESKNLKLSKHESIIVNDVVDYYRDLIRLGDSSLSMKEKGTYGLSDFNSVYKGQINRIYKKRKLKTSSALVGNGVICQPFIFGDGLVDWENADQLRSKLDTLLKEKSGAGIAVTRVARIYDGNCIYIIKPNRLRYWLRSIALRDADETLADLAEQGF